MPPSEPSDPPLASDDASLAAKPADSPPSDLAPPTTSPANPPPKRAPLSLEARAKISAALSGRRLSDAHRARISSSLSREKNPRYGKAVSESVRAAISEAKRGGKQSEEVRQKIAEGMRRAHAKKRAAKGLPPKEEPAPKEEVEDTEDQHDSFMKDLEKKLHEEAAGSVKKGLRGGSTRAQKAKKKETRRSPNEQLVEATQEPESTSSFAHDSKEIELAVGDVTPVLVCTICDGKGMSPCSRCETLPHASASCVQCFGSGFQFCSACGGSGHSGRLEVTGG